MRLGTKVGFLGAGNMNQSIIAALIESKTLTPEQIFVSNRTPGKLEKLKTQFGVNTVSTNEELADNCTVIIIGVKPFELEEALEPIESAFSEGTTLISLAAGVELPKLKALVPNVNWVRVMANTATSVRRSVIGYCVAEENSVVEAVVEDLFSPMGTLIELEDGEAFSAFTVAASSGVGFVYELMIYWQEWLEEHDFTPEQARQISVETFAGASLLASQSPNISLDELQQRVTSKKGMTAVGLDSMRELETERTLRYSFEKAALKEKQLRE